MTCVTRGRAGERERESSPKLLDQRLVHQELDVFGVVVGLGCRVSFSYRLLLARLTWVHTCTATATSQTNSCVSGCSKRTPRQRKRVCIDRTLTLPSPSPCRPEKKNTARSRDMSAKHVAVGRGRRRSRERGGCARGVLEPPRGQVRSSPFKMHNRRKSGSVSWSFCKAVAEPAECGGDVP
jgi:hypothetical protein